MSLTPLPSGAHEVPSHTAMLLAGTPPAEVNVPPATTRPSGSAANAQTDPPALTPPPRVDHEVPSHRATQCPVLDRPPAMTSPLGSTTSAFTSPPRAPLKFAPSGTHPGPW